MVLTFIEYSLLFFFFFNVGYLLIFGVASHFKMKDQKNVLEKYNKFLVLVPAYQEDKVILNSISKNRLVDYPESAFDIMVAADGLKTETGSELKKMGVLVKEVAFDQSTKAKSINAALSDVSDTYEYVIILDIDNVMDVGFMQKINQEINKGFKAVQGKRTALNVNTPVAFLDGLNEQINNKIFRRGHRNLGISSALIGSGMAFEINLFKRIMLPLSNETGEDKELEMQLHKEHIKIQYAEEAIVYDQKTEGISQFGAQRTRWIGTQASHLENHITSFYEAIRERNVDHLNKLLQAFVLPRTILIAILTFLTCTSIVLGSKLAIVWLAIFALLTALLISLVPKAYVKSGLAEAILALPMVIVVMFRSMFNLRKGMKKFIHTSHNYEE